MTATLKLQDTYLDASLLVGPCPIEVERHKTDRQRFFGLDWTMHASFRVHRSSKRPNVHFNTSTSVIFAFEELVEGDYNRHINRWLLIPELREISFEVIGSGLHANLHPFQSDPWYLAIDGRGFTDTVDPLL
ncbi:hypothetical protein BD769DRAFT_1385558 [Suillus cothurnatus]|nr:hypothetical protein BD769DRAFT_1385558 [Suillus cothurnatus]